MASRASRDFSGPYLRFRMHSRRAHKFKKINITNLARLVHKHQNYGDGRIETKNFASKFEVKNILDLDKFRNMSFEELVCF